MDTNISPSGSPWKAVAASPGPPTTHPKLRFVPGSVIPGVILLLIAAGMVAGYLDKWLWMGQPHLAGILWTLLSVQWPMYAVPFVVVFLFMWLNLRHALLVGGAPAGPGSTPRVLVRLDGNAERLELTPYLLQYGIVIVSLVVAWLAASAFFGEWDTWLRFRYRGASDPLYGIDVSSYVFRMPFYQMLQTSVVLLTVLAIGGVGLIYASLKVVSHRGGGRAALGGWVVSHFSVLLFILAANWGFGLLADHYQLVYSTMGIVHGEGYAAAHLALVALWGMLVLSAVVCAVLAVNVFRPRLTLVLKRVRQVRCQLRDRCRPDLGPVPELRGAAGRTGLRNPYLKNLNHYTNAPRA